MSLDHPLTPQEAAALLQRRRSARHSFRDYLKLWIDATHAPFMWNWHIEYLADILQGVADRDSALRFLIVNIPPRFMKSTLISQQWQAWMIGREDNRRSSLFSISTTAQLAARDSRRTLDTVRSDWYRQLFPHVSIGAKETEQEWETKAGSYRIACGAGGTVTGRGADHLTCIAKGEMVTTERGDVPIELVQVGDRVATPFGWRAVTRSVCNGIKRVVRIVTDQSTLTLTPDHRCSTPDGWRQAADLRVGGCLHALSPDFLDLCGVRKAVHGEPPADNEVQSAMCGARPLEGQPGRGEEMPNLRKDVSPGNEHDEARMLFHRMQRPVAIGPHARQQEPAMEGRIEGVVPIGVRQEDQPDASRGDPGMPAVCNRSERGGPSQERHQDGRLTGESYGAVPPVSQRIARDPSPCGEAKVYDLTIDGAHCFYANGILVHNCDDPLKADEANSELVRENTNEWLGETLRSRLDDQKTGTITVIMQRLHERDPTGYLLDQMKVPGADQYTHIVLPNEATRRTVVDFKGTVYAVREPGDLLHPARIGAAETAALKAAMRANYEGQYQQNPVKMQGGHLDPRRLLRLQGTALEIKSRLGLIPVFYLDFAATTKQAQKSDPDYSVIHVAARDQLGRLIHLDIWRKQLSDYAELARTLINMHKLWRPRFVKGERGALLSVFQPVLQQQMSLSGHFLTLEPLPTRRSDKIERSMSYQGMLNAGMVAVPQEAPWLPAFESEMRAFWNGAHDDQLEGGWDAAADYQTLPRGEAPYTSPDDPSVILSDDIKQRINAAIERAHSPPVDEDGHYW